MKPRFETREDFITAINKEIEKIPSANAIVRDSLYIRKEIIMDSQFTTRKRLVIEWEVFNEREEKE
jgi:hypothetical protein